MNIQNSESISGYIGVDVDVDVDRVLGTYISSQHDTSHIRKKESIYLDDPPTASIALGKDRMQNIRDNFYLKIINNADAKDRLVNKLHSVIKGLEESGKFKRYIPTEAHPIHVFKNSSLCGRITSEIATIGALLWNTIVGKQSKGVSRIHAIIMFMIDPHNKIHLIVLDTWSHHGTCIFDKRQNVTGISKGDSRNVLIKEINDCVKLKCGKEFFTFSTVSGKSCVVCMDAIQEVRFKCGHGVVCNKCADLIRTCPTCKIFLAHDEIELSMCDKTYNS